LIGEFSSNQVVLHQHYNVFIDPAKMGGTKTSYSMFKIDVIGGRATHPHHESEDHDPTLKGELSHVPNRGFRKFVGDRKLWFKSLVVFEWGNRKARVEMGTAIL